MEEKLKILVVDDDDVDRMAVRRSLKASGIDAEVTEAGDATGALDCMQRSRYDCALFDYRMPGSDGLELLRRMRADGIATPVIMLTGFGDEQTAVELMKAGASDYLPKNTLTPERLAQSLRAVLRIHQAEVEAGKAEDQLRLYASQLRSLAETGAHSSGAFDWRRRCGNLRRQFFDYVFQCPFTYVRRICEQLA